MIFTTSNVPIQILISKNNDCNITQNSTGGKRGSNKRKERPKKRNTFDKREDFFTFIIYDGYLIL
jgi:hypothetical protein